MELRYYLHKLVMMAGALLLFASVSPAQVSPNPYIPATYFDNSGRICSGCSLYTYESGTTTPLVSYQDAAGTIPNSDPIITSAAGRAFVFLTGSAYTLVLNDSHGNLVWSIDGITGTNSSLLSSNNTWSGTNTWQSTSTFNGPTNFEVGFTSLGPNTLGGGGTITGTWAGSPTTNGTWSFSGQINAVNIVYSGQIFSTMGTGSPPFVVDSTTEVPNLNVGQLEGCTWQVPCPIGGTTPNTAIFSDIVDNGPFFLGGIQVNTIKGLDTALYTAGTIAGGAGHGLCTDSNGSATTSGCATSGITLISLGTNGSVCSTTNSAGATCTTTVTISPTQADTSYIPSCQGIGASGNPYIADVHSLTTTSITVTISNGTASSATVSTYASLACSAIHP